MTQPEGVQDIIEGIRIDMHFLVQRRKLLEKGAVVIFSPVLHFCLLEEIAVFLGHLCGEGFHLCNVTFARHVAFRNVLPPSRGGQTIGDQPAASFSENSQISQR